MKSIFFVLMMIFACHIDPSFAGKGDTSSKPSKGKGGWGESYGGNGEIAEFKSKAMEVFYFALKNGDALNLNLTYANAQAAISEALVLCARNLTLNGVTKDAINYPKEWPQRIELDCSKWSTLDINEKRILAVHEFLPLLGFEDVDYRLSTDLIIHYKSRRDYAEDKSRLIFQSASYCDGELFEYALKREGNPFYTNADNRTTLDAAIAGRCPYLVKELLSLGVKLDHERFSVLAIRPEYILIDNALNDILTLGDVHAPWIISDVVTILKTIMPKQELNDYLLGLNNFDVGFDECENNNEMMAVIFKKYKRAIGTKIEKREFVRSFARELVFLGLPIDKVDACDQSARDILTIYNLL